MSVSEGDESGIEPLPAYTIIEGIEDEQRDLQTLRSCSGSDEGIDQNMTKDVRRRMKAKGTGTRVPETILRFLESPPGMRVNELIRAQQQIVDRFFRAISDQQDEVVTSYLTRGLVTPNTTAQDGKTPLLAAVATRNTPMVQKLLDFGAEADGWGVEHTEWDMTINQQIEIQRTPLQLAASLGQLPLVKLLMEIYHCDDSLVAPDGQIALRLAAENGHREVVNYLPARRSGGFLRWQHHHQKAIRRSKKALTKAYEFLKFFIWDIEKFFLWTVPKFLIVEPLAKGCAWCWKHRKEFGPWCRHQIQQIPGRTKRFAKRIWKGIKKIPKAAADAGNGIWKFGTVTLPKWLKRVALWFWNFLTKRIPAATAIAARWLWRCLSSIGKAIWDVILKSISFLHTVCEAIVTFFRTLTLKDIWNGFCELLRTIFVQIPRTIYTRMVEFADESFKFMITLLGWLGEAFWYMIGIIGWIAVYVPKKLWVVLKSLLGSFVKAWYEVLVFVRPKT